VRFTVGAGFSSLGAPTPLVTGLPRSSGRHSGCRVRIGPDGNLWVTTGDAAVGTNAQDPQSLGGKVLRVHTDGTIPPGNMGAPFRPEIYAYGFRNPQGITFRSDGTPFVIEHGSDRDDEINEGVTGNFGWDPGGTGYDESGVPMTDKVKFPDAIDASWSSGSPTIATSGATWLTGDLWKGWNGGLAVANLKDTSLKVFYPDGNGNLRPIATVLDDTYGRLRTAQLGPNGHLFVTTSNGSGRDQILEVFPG
jgi:glucose/arabinose dehydrogenase